ncbi:hypothetical protein ACGFNU_37060 [Spirillospora sp. NPDC048911]|uniref:hypothetical protein n=1 Tax=Spirillospora sp. NPDC048911 TaxID=3364527 RepID=UPI00371C30B7
MWRLQADALREISERPAPPPALVERAALLFDVYSLLLLYSGSCSSTRYAATVRADMAAFHPGFSGTWARDHEPIPVLLRSVRHRHSSTLSAPLTRAATTNHRVHMAVATKLVPTGRSLLQQHGDVDVREVPDSARALYDAFFHVQRGPVCQAAVAAQLLRRLAQMACDIAVHGLDDSGWTPPSAVAGVAGRSHDLLLTAAETFASSANLVDGAHP